VGKSVVFRREIARTWVLTVSDLAREIHLCVVLPYGELTGIRRSRWEVLGLKFGVRRCQRIEPRRRHQLWIHRRGIHTGSAGGRLRRIGGGGHRSGCRHDNTRWATHCDDNGDRKARAEQNGETKTRTPPSDSGPIPSAKTLTAPHFAPACRYGHT
jgi:hypothetical protein